MQRKLRKWVFFLSKELGHNLKVLFVILLAIGLSTGTTLFVNGLGAGFVDNIAGRVIYLTTSEILVEPQGDMRYIDNLSVTEGILSQKGYITGYSPRTVIPSIIHDNITNKDRSCNVFGIVPSKESKTTNIAKQINSGRFLQDTDKNKAVIGIGLLKEFNNGTNSNFEARVVFSNGKTMDIQIVGVINSHFAQLDDQSLFMMKNDVDGILNISDKAMTILIKTDNLKKAQSYAANLQQDLPKVKVTSWDKHASYLNDIKSTFGFVLGIVQILSLIGAVVPVATVLYTNIINKTKDIGIYKAIGSNRGFILLLYSATCMIIGVLGVLIGWLIGGVMILYFQAYPLVFTSPMGVSYLSPAFDAQAFLPPSILIFIAILVAGLYPAWKASRIEPVEAFRFG